MAYIWPVSCLAVLPQSPGILEAHIYSCCISGFMSAMVFSLFFFHIVIRPIFHICLPVTLHFFLSLSNVPTLTVMRKIHGSGEIALFQYRRGRCTNYSSTQIKLLTAVIPSYYRSSTLERHTDLPLQCTAPVTIVFRIIRRFSVVP